MRVPVKVLIVGQTPPPYHGQAIMIQMLLDGPTPGIQLHHVRMAFSENMDQVGRFQLAKVLHLFHLIIRVIWVRFRYGIPVLYYPPAGPNKIPIIRDTILLLCTRWLFSKTIFHFQAAGISEMIPRFPGWLRFFVTRALRRPDVAIQLSQLLASDAAFLEAKRVVTIPNAADDHARALLADLRPSQAKSGENEWLHVTKPSETIRLLYLGTVCEAKGILVLLDACSGLHKSTIKFHLDVVGSFQPADLERSVRDRIELLGLTEFVTLHGQLVGDAKWKMFSQSDVFCFPSHYESEGFPCVLVEAMSFRLPIVSTKWRGIPSIVAEEQTGLLVEPHDIGSLTDALSRLITSPELRSRLGHNARVRYEHEFTREKHLQQMCAVFQEVAGAQARVLGASG